MIAGVVPRREVICALLTDGGNAVIDNESNYYYLSASLWGTAQPTGFGLSFAGCRVAYEHGFEHTVAEVAKLERAFGVDDLGKLTA